MSSRHLLALHIFDEGRAYTEREHREWLTTMKFEHVTRVPISEGNSIITARKPV
jgi:hypothetical protein